MKSVVTARLMPGYVIVPSKNSLILFKMMKSALEIMNFTLQDCEMCRYAPYASLLRGMNTGMVRRGQNDFS